MPATMSIRGLAVAEDTLWNEMVLPTGMTADDKEIITDNIILECAELEILYTDPWFMRKAIGSWSKKELPTWERIYQASLETYNPIENYNRTEVTTESGSDSRTVSGTGSETHSGTDSQVHSGTDTQAHTGKDTVQNSGSDSSQTSSTTTTQGTHTDTNSGTDTVNHSRMAFDSNTAVTTDTDTTQHGHVLTQGINDSVSESGSASVTHGQKVETTHGESIGFTHGESIGFTHGESIATTSGNTSTGENEITRNSHVSGNIGVTTSQQMLEQEIIVSPKLNVYNYIVTSFKNRFCIEVY